MSNFIIRITCEPYLAQWATHHFGNPVEFPVGSIENRLIRRFLDKEPTAVPDTSGNLLVAIPYSKEKDPRSGWTYLSPSARKAVRESLYTLMLRNLWTELGDLAHVNCELSTLIYSWLEKHGMDDSSWETIRQKYYRLRKLYGEKGIDLLK